MPKIPKEHPVTTTFLMFLVIFAIAAVAALADSREYSFCVDCAPNAVFEGITETTVLADPSGEPLLRVLTAERHEDYLRVRMVANRSGNAVVKYVCRFSEEGHSDRIETRMMHIHVLPSGIIFIGTGLLDFAGFIHFWNAAILFFAVAALYWLGFLRRTIRENRYSYRVITASAVLLFLLELLSVYIGAMAEGYGRLHQPDIITLSMLTANTLVTSVISSMPLIILFALVLCVSNAALIRHEGLRPQNALGMLAGIGLLTGAVAVAFLMVGALETGFPNALFSALLSFSATLLKLTELGLLSAIFACLLAGTHTPEYDREYIIILGCRIRKDGTLYPLVRGRVDRAIDFYHKQLKRTGKAPILIPSGGKGSDEPISEGEAMRNYLLEHGIPEDHIIAETRSATTRENMLFSKQIIETDGRSHRTAFSTTNYHVFRSGMIARRAGLSADGMGAPTKWYFWPNAQLREAAGLVFLLPKRKLVLLILFAIFSALAGYGYAMIA